MSAYDELIERMKEIDLISQIGGLLSWDQEVIMPPKAAALRAEQLAYLSSIKHEKMTDQEIGLLLNKLENIQKHPLTNEHLAVRPENY